MKLGMANGTNRVDLSRFRSSRLSNEFKTRRVEPRLVTGQMVRIENSENESGLLTRFTRDELDPSRINLLF